MQCLVVYDTAYGNTAKVAQAIAGALGTKAVELATVDAPMRGQYDLLIVGSPTQGGRPTKAMTDWLARLEPGALANTKIAAFDTRLAISDVNVGLRLLMGVIGYAAPRIEMALVAKGGVTVAEAEGFIVGGKNGPLRAGETERAALWGRTISLLIGGQAVSA